MREFNEDQIIYRGEGNSNIVIAVQDKSKVIRLLKSDGSMVRSGTTDQCVMQHLKRSLRFLHSIMKPLTSPYLSDNTELVHLKTDFINVLSKKIEDKRPAHRLYKTLNLENQFALVMDDLCDLPPKLTKHLQAGDFIGPTISVEIKPKQGFLLPPEGLNAAMQTYAKNDKTITRMKSSCLYGLNQHFKLARGKIEEISSYCPLNLFSGCPNKMRASLRALLDNPQNNLRVFKNLMLAYGETDRRALLNLFDDSQTDSEMDALAHESQAQFNRERLIDLLIKCLLSEPSTCDQGYRAKQVLLASSNLGDDDENSFSEKDVSDHCSRHSMDINSSRCDNYQCSRTRKPVSRLISSDPIHKLPRSCVLACILRAQKLDSIGPFEAKRMLEWLIEDSKRDERLPLRHRANDVLEELSKPRVPKGFGAQAKLSHETKRDFYFRKVWEFLVSLTAKDCSIMITIRQITKAAHAMLQSHMFSDNLIEDRTWGKHYVFNVGIVDFDQKMPLKIFRICDNLQHIMFLMQNHVFTPSILPSGESQEQPERDMEMRLSTIG